MLARKYTHCICEAATLTLVKFYINVALSVIFTEYNSALSIISTIEYNFNAITDSQFQKVKFSERNFPESAGVGA